MAARKKTPKKKPGARKKSGSFSFSPFQRAAVIILGVLIAVNIAGALYLRTSINRRIARDIEKASDFHSTGDFRESLEIINRLIEIRPSVAEMRPVLYMKAAALKDSSDMERAEAIWREIVSSEPDERYYPSSLFHLARIKKDNNFIDEALAAYKSIMENFPEAEIIPDVLYDSGECYAGMGAWDDARGKFERILDAYPGSRLYEKAARKLGDMNTDLIFSSAMTSFDTRYTVEPGDSLERIASRFNTTTELIMRANDMASPVIHPGRRLKITPGKFEIFVDADSNVMYLEYDGRFFKRYPVGTGADDKTPKGEFVITDKIKNPVWFSGTGVYPFGHPENILGTRWMGINVPKYGIHGTTMPETIGTHETAGCIRMYNEDVEELYRLVTSGTPVTISGRGGGNAR